MVHFHGTGRFGKSGPTVLQNCYKLIEKKWNYQYELQWLQDPVGISFSESSHLVEFCLGTGNPLGRPLKFIGDDFFLYMDDFVLLIGERYQNDSLTDFLLAKFEEEQAETRGSRQVVTVSSFLVEEWNTPCYDLNCLKRIIVPFNLQGNHWGLLVLDVSRKVVVFDDGFHQSSLITFAVLVKVL